ncbi:MAG TPA: acetylornithine transaminase [Candidatus Bathyarchaeia archaeon]|nr:acetylornithine transaminase [Candidatus Bathyarchaeia archaeon]
MTPTVSDPAFAFDSLMEITERPEIVFVKGAGSWLTDHRGKRYLDFVQGWAVTCLGHCPAVVTDALVAQARELITPSPAFYNEPALRLAKLIASHSSFQRVFFANSGAEANEGAIKLARKWGRRFKGGAFEIITFDHSFHGRTLATMSASGKPGWDTMFAPQVDGFPKATLNDIASVEALISEKTAAVMLEPVQGEAGVLPATVDFLRDLRALTKQRNCLLIADEVQTGMGRTGKLFAYEHFARSHDEAPDIMTLGKGLGGGVPLAALCAKEAVSVFSHGEQGGTFNGSPLMTAVGSAVMETMLAPGFLDGVAASGRYLGDRLNGLVGELHLSHERGAGLLRALDLGAAVAGAAAAYARDDLEKHPGWEGTGLLLNAPRPDTLRFMPALNVTRAEIDRMIDGARLAIQAIL